jgi:hypothetical protein
MNPYGQSYKGNSKKLKTQQQQPLLQPVLDEVESQPMNLVSVQDGGKRRKKQAL